MVIKEELLKGIEKLSPEDRLKRLKQIEEEIKLEEKITEGMIVKEKQELREKTEADEKKTLDDKKKKDELKEKELEDVVNQEKIKKQQQELQQVQYHAKLITEVDQSMNKFNNMNSEQLSESRSQMKDMYDSLTQAYDSSQGWIRDDIRHAKEELKKWWEKAPNEDYI
tara:strand:+ start:52 stop:555 length:504 start_codon:yes stop_codon:yes gene_type:complete